MRTPEWQRYGEQRAVFARRFNLGLAACIADATLRGDEAYSVSLDLRTRRQEAEVFVERLRRYGGIYRK